MRINNSNKHFLFIKKSDRLIKKTHLIKLSTFIFIAFISGFVFYTFQVTRYSLNNLKKSYLIIEKLSGNFLERINDNLKEEISLYQSNGLQNLYIDLPFKSEQLLNDKKEEAIETGILFSSDEDFVPAKIGYSDQTNIDVELRLKGDWTDHLEGDKLSFRIHVKGENQIHGMTHFSIQAPETRTFINEWLFHQNLMKEGILTTRYDFVNVIINGEYKGVYALEESFAEELIESQERRQGVLLRFDEDLMWRNFEVFVNEDTNDKSSLLVTNLWTSDISGFREGHVSSDINLSAQARMAANMLYSYQRGELLASEIFDVQQMGKVFAICDLWQAKHSLIWHNLRFYYNPISGLIEPVIFDGNPFVEGDAVFTYAEFTDNPLFSDPEIHRSYLVELSRISQPDYISEIKEAFSIEASHFQSALNRDYEGVDLFGYGEGVGFPWILLEKRAEILRMSIENN